MQQQGTQLDHSGEQSVWLRAGEEMNPKKRHVFRMGGARVQVRPGQHSLLYIEAGLLQHGTDKPLTKGGPDMIASALFLKRMAVDLAHKTAAQADLQGVQAGGLQQAIAKKWEDDSCSSIKAKKPHDPLARIDTRRG